MPNSALDYAIGQFEYRQKVTGRALPHDPDWQRLIGESLTPALAGERGKTDQQQCVYQAIRLAVWESGAVPKPWTKAFLPAPAAQPVAWYRRWWNSITAWGRSILKRFE